MTTEAENNIVQAIADAEEIDEPAFEIVMETKPRLQVDNSNPDKTVAALRDVLADAGKLYDRGVPVRLTFDQLQRGTAAQVITPNTLVLEAHSVCRPFVRKIKKDGSVHEENAKLPRFLCEMYLDWRGEWQ